jgi:polyhydroxyalkanoate synthesis regulator phasin
LGADTVSVQPGLYRRISWGAVIGGTLMVVAVQLLLSMLGLGLGLTTIDPAQGPGGSPEASTMGTTAVVWWAVTYLVALIIGGYVAARLAGAFEKTDGVLHGLLTWALALVVSFWLLTSAIGGIIGGAFNVVGNAVSGITSTVADAVPQVANASGLSPEQVQQRVQDLMRPADQTGQSPEAAQSELASLAPRVIAGGPEGEQAQQRAIQIVSQQAGISEDEARARVDQLRQQAEQTAQQAEATARQAADTAASALTSASLWGFGALLLGAIASAIGGASGTRRREELNAI